MGAFLIIFRMIIPTENATRITKWHYKLPCFNNMAVLLYQYLTSTLGGIRHKAIAYRRLKMDPCREAKYNAIVIPGRRLSSS
jgi:hypothetical protein